MPHTRPLASPSRLVLAALLAGLSLAGCNQAGSGAANTAANVAESAPPAGALPPVSADVALAPAPAASALPSAPPPRIGRVASSYDAYAFADRAAEMSRAFADAPPDYTYDEDGVRPWVWRTNDGYVRVVEPVPGGQRYYYYEPGSDEPFFVQDPDYGYGFDSGMLVVIYDRSGHQMSPDSSRAEWAGRYLLRAQVLYSAAQNQPHVAVSVNNWWSARDAIAAQNRAWAEQQQQDADWRAYHQAHDAQDQAHWEAERLERMVWAARVDQMADDPARAQRDWQAAQSEAQSAGRPPPPPLPPPAGGPPVGYASRAPLAPPQGQSGYGPSPGAPPPVEGQPNPAGQQAAAAAAAAAQANAQRAAAAQAAAAQQAEIARQQQAAQANAQAKVDLARRQAAAGQAAQQRAAAEQAQASLARQQQAAAQALAARAGEQRAAAEQAQESLVRQQQAAAQAQAAREAQQRAAAEQAQANLARQQQVAAQAQALKMRAAQQQAAAARAGALQAAQAAAQAQKAAAAAAPHHASAGGAPPPQQGGPAGEGKRTHRPPPASNAADGKAAQ